MKTRDYVSSFMDARSTGVTVRTAERLLLAMMLKDLARRIKLEKSEHKYGKINKIVISLENQWDEICKKLKKYPLRNNQFMPFIRQEVPELYAGIMSSRRSPNKEIVSIKEIEEEKKNELTFEFDDA